MPIQETKHTEFTGPSLIRRMLGPVTRRLHLVGEILRTRTEVQVHRSQAARPAWHCRPLNLISANLWHDWPRFRRIHQRLNQFSELAQTEEADILLLQEAARTPGLHAAQWIAERLGMHFFYAPANGSASIRFEEGLAVLSRFPLHSPELRQLASSGSSGFVHRLALGASIDTPCGLLKTFSVHLSLRRRRNAGQVLDLQTWISGITSEEPVLIGGDFNASETSPQIKSVRISWMDTFRSANPSADGATHSLSWPWGGELLRRRLDYVFLKNSPQPWRVIESRHLRSARRPHSDHHAVFVRLAPQALF